MGRSFLARNADARILEYFQHQQVADLKQTFDWLSCGLVRNSFSRGFGFTHLPQFKNYWDWEDWLNPKHFMDSDIAAWSSVDTIRELEPSELIDLLAYADGKDKADSQPAESAKSDPTAPLRCIFLLELK